MSTIKNVALVGAAGNLGSVVFNKLVASGKFHVKVLRRLGSTSAFPQGTDVVDVDFSSLESLKAALQGQDAVISTLASMAIDTQRLLVDAAIAAGVSRFIPSEFGSNLNNPKTRQLPVFGPKVKLQDYLIEKSKGGDLTYTVVYNSAFLDWGLEQGFILKTSDYKPTIVDGGDLLFSTTTISSIADAVVGILSHPDETKNRAVFISDAVVTQNQLLALAKTLAPNKPWAPTYVKLDDLTAAADARLAKGLLGPETFVPYLYRSIFDPGYGGNFQKTDNELLGVKGKTEKDIIEILRPLLT
ncbi:putative oxidoreductase [Phialemonium atrogriseum]|uniref:Oxidoreductase n=1 Tax=Phialemonium atrogriseum TaxID=1093897 RepID=A0AAJ0BWY9_9PEZI|nr:putative oxidoreductase [Phialemonium atrogriseum]KAK1766014.1 putative oxidoreductase [Phialemonium atrogriseum]